MKLACSILHKPNGVWVARYAGPTLGPVEIAAATKDEALAKLRDELQYRTEMCPCSAANEDRVELDARETV